MDTQTQFRFRRDLTVTVKPATVQSDAPRYLVQEPRSGATFELGEEEFFLCQSLDGVLTPEDVMGRFGERFGVSITPEDYHQFLVQMDQMGLLESVMERPADHEIALGHAPGKDPKLTEPGSGKFELQAVEDSPGLYLQSEINDQDDESANESKREDDPYRFALLKQPEPLFDFLLALCRPFRPLFLLWTWALWIGVPMALFTYFKNQDQIWQDIESRPVLTFIEAMILSLLTINLLIRSSKGIVSRYYGITLNELGIRLRFGFIPRWYIASQGAQQLSREDRLWFYGTSSLLRLSIFVIGVFTWSWLRGSGTQLAVWSISFAKIALFTFIILSLPILPRDGYRWFVTFFRLPPNLWQQAAQVAIRVLHRRPLPTISPWLLLYGLVLLPVWVIIIVRVLIRNSIRLASSFPDIFGRATFFIVFCLAFLLILQWLWPRLSKLIKPDQARQAPMPRGNGRSLSPTNGQTAIRFTGSRLYAGVPAPTPWYRRWQLWFLLVILGAVLCLPFPYRPGGFIQLLPPEQMAMQAPISGQVTRVFFNGGDGALIPAGTVIATITSSELENNVLTLQEQVNQAKANLDKQQANLKQVSAKPIPEAVEVARRQLEVAKQEVAVARQRVQEAQEQIAIFQSQLESAMVTAEYSANDVTRLESLVSQGAFSQQQLEEAKERAATAQIKVDIQRGELSAAQQNLVESQQQLMTQQRVLEEEEAQFRLASTGATVDEIEAARQNVEAASAELKRLEQEWKFAQSQNQSTNLFMPLDGSLVDSYLNRRVGTYINKGETFALAQNNQTLLGEMEIPEYDSGAITVGTPASVKLLAYPNQPLTGTVISVDPVTSEEDFGLVFKALVQFTNAEGNLKPGMSGYGKIDAGEQPLIILLTRPLVRFLQVEFWSWLP